MWRDLLIEPIQKKTTWPERSGIDWPFGSRPEFPAAPRPCCQRSENTDLTPQSLGWPCSRNLEFAANCLPWTSNPSGGNYTAGSLRRTDTSSHCSGTPIGPPHYIRCSSAPPAQTCPADILAVWHEGLSHARQHYVTEIMTHGSKSGRTEHQTLILARDLSYLTYSEHDMQYADWMLHISAAFLLGHDRLGLKLDSFWRYCAKVMSLPEKGQCDISIRNHVSSIMNGQPCKWILFSGLWTKTELTESRLS